MKVKGTGKGRRGRPRQVKDVSEIRGRKVNGELKAVNGAGFGKMEVSGMSNAEYSRC